MAVEKGFCLGYAMQSAIHALWWERNKRRHGEPHIQAQVFKKIVEKSIRNKLSLNGKNGHKKLRGTLSFGLEVESRSKYETNKLFKF